MNSDRGVSSFEWRTLEGYAFIAAAAGVVATLAGAIFDPVQGYQSYLPPYLFWLGVSLGSLAIILLHHLTGGVWGRAIRPVLAAASGNLLLFAVLFLPILAGLEHLYPWAGEAVEHDAEVSSRAWYFRLPIFAGRAVFYFVVWCGIHYLLIRRIGRRVPVESPGGEQGLLRPRFSAVGLILYVLTVTFASIDWIMSLDADWYSSIFGLLTAAGHLLSAFAMAIASVTLLAGSTAPRRSIVDGSPAMAEGVDVPASPDTLNDLGNLLWAFSMIWGYLTFSQFLIIWSGNLPEEIPWYLRRTAGGWQWLITASVGLYVLPFLSLVSRRTKRVASRLGGVALAMFGMSYIAQFWTVVPAFFPAQFHLHWLDVAALIGLTGLWLGMFLRRLRIGDGQ